MQNKYINLDKELTIADSYGKGVTVVASEATFQEIAMLDTFGWKPDDLGINSYKGHNIIIDNNLELGKYIILKTGEKYAIQ